MARKVAVIGAGGMGSWFARFFKSREDSVVVSDSNPNKARRLASRICIDYAANNVEAVRGMDIVILATPASVISDIVKEIVPYLKKNAALIEISAVKSAVIPALRMARRREVRVACIHPMFGPLASNVRGKVMIVAESGKEGYGTKMARRLFPGARVVCVNPREHDKKTAATLALPHFLNMVFAELISSRRDFPEIRKLAGRTFSLQMLLAEAIAHEPDTIADIQIMNKEFDAVLVELLRRIRSLAGIVNKRDRSGLASRYRRIGEHLSADAEFKKAQTSFERVCQAASTVPRKERQKIRG